MWFNNALIYHYHLEKNTELASLLGTEKLKPCPPHARFIYGWAPVIGDELVHEVAGSAVICMSKEERLLPRGVIQRLLAERVQALETQRGFAVKRAEKAQMSEDLEFELLPKAFCVQKRLLALFDQVNHYLIINTASTNQAAQLLALLRKSILNITIEPLLCPDHLAMRFAEWINQPHHLPPNFALASDCLLFSPANENKRVQCKGYELPATEVLTLLSQGLYPAEISLIWNERIQLTLTQDLILKRLKCLDYLVDDFNEIHQLDEEYQQRDAALTLFTGELSGLLKDLFGSLNVATVRQASLEVAE